MLKNKIYAELDKRWIDYNNIFTNKGKMYLRSLKIDAIDDYLDIIDFLDKKIDEIDNKIKDIAENDRYAKIIKTIPGFSYYSSLLISSIIADIDRFANYKHLCSYARLVPSVRQSGDKLYYKQDKRGDPMLQWIMIQCTYVHVRNCNSSIARYYNKVKSRRGNNIAIVAAARKMMKAIYMMLKENRTFRLDG